MNIWHSAVITAMNSVQTMLCTTMLCGISLTTAHASPEHIQYQQQSIELAGQHYTVRLPTGYRLELLGDKLDGPRLLTFLPNKELLIGSKSGHIYRLYPPYTHPQVLLTLDDYPHSVAYRNGELFIAQTHGLYKLAYQPGQQSVDAAHLQRVAVLPGSGHSSRTVRVGPDQRIYLSLGISGNCSDEYLHDTYAFKYRRGGILVLEENTHKTRLVPYASGLRNPVGFDWHPQSGVMYASNNGPDHQGFELPPEYFSRIETGSFHGMPWYQFNGQTIRRDSCIRRQAPKPVTTVPAPVATFPARNAPMGVSFIPAKAMDHRFIFDAVVALRGSWATRTKGNSVADQATRRPPKLVVVRFDDGRAQGVDDLVTGFQLDNGKRWARPVGVAIGPDGDLYFTSDSGINGLFRLRRLIAR